MAEMPEQLRRAKRRPRRSEPRPVIELLPSINIHELRHAIPTYQHAVHTLPDVSLRYHELRSIRLAFHAIELIDHSGRKQQFALKWVRTYFGRHRAVLLCNCGRGAIRLFARYGTYRCRACTGAVYTSQRQDSKGRKRFQACKLRLELGGLPDINEPFAAKRKWAHRKRYQRLRNQAKALETAISPKRFRKPIDTRIFAYHLAG
jgi:hypothetical protein